MRNLEKVLKRISLGYHPLFLTFLFLGIFLLFSYKLTSVPPGINIDELSIGFNASLLSRTLMDENGRLLPVFVLTIGGRDWKQPITIYTTAFLFKIFGPSFFLLRLVSVIFTLVSSYLFLKILGLFFSKKLAIVGLLIFLLSPLLMIQSHLALENIALLPFVLGWLYFLLAYERENQPPFLFISGLSLGLSFYSYKGMRAFVPVYFAISLIYLVFLGKEKTPRFLAPFLMGLVPFMLPIRWLQTSYAGSIYDPKVVSFPSFFEAAYTYLSSFDLSFLFVLGDKMIVHSTGRHGVFLIPTLPLFFLGVLQLVKEKKRAYYFILATLLVTPLPLIFIGSTYRASRLMSYLPLFAFILTLGIKKIYEFKQSLVKNILLAFFAFTLIGSYIDFVSYYWGKYPVMAREDFSPNINQAMAKLAEIADKTDKRAFIEESEYLTFQAEIDFFEQIYFLPSRELYHWDRRKSSFPLDGVVLSTKGADSSLGIAVYEKIPNLVSGQTDFYILGGG